MRPWLQTHHTRSYAWRRRTPDWATSLDLATFLHHQGVTIRYLYRPRGSWGRVFGPLLHLFLSYNELEFSRVGNPFTIRRIKEIYKSISQDIMFLLETKNDDNFIKSKLCSLQYPHYFSVPPLGTGGGLTLLWKDNITVEILESSPNIIVV